MLDSNRSTIIYGSQNTFFGTFRDKGSRFSFGALEKVIPPSLVIFRTFNIPVFDTNLHFLSKVKTNSYIMMYFGRFNLRSFSSSFRGLKSSSELPYFTSSVSESTSNSSVNKKIYVTKIHLDKKPNQVCHTTIKRKIFLCFLPALKYNVYSIGHREKYY